MNFDLKALSERRIPIKYGWCFLPASHFEREAVKKPVHFICDDYPEIELIDFAKSIGRSHYIDFIKFHFFGASLFYDQLILFGPDFLVSRSLRIEDWTPISWRFENLIAAPPGQYVLKIGVLNGYETQYGMWADAIGKIGFFDQEMVEISSIESADFFGFLARYQEFFIAKADRRGTADFDISTANFVSS